MDNFKKIKDYHSTESTSLYLTFQSARRPQFSYARGSELRMWKLRLYYRDFVQANSNMADKTAGQLLLVNKASVKAFEPRTS